jgi:ABC-2 type transport system ATP-binding protein
MSDAVLSARGLTRTFSTGAGIRDIDLDVRAGEVVALVGLNGAGKSTLMRALLGMLRPDAGEVRLGGVPLPRVATSSWARVGHLVEYPLTYPELSVRRNLELSARLRGVRDPTTVVTAIVEELALVPYLGRATRKLSLGNRQRVGIAAALQHDPDVIVLDEPTNSLDPAGVILLRESLLRRARQGSAVLVSSHHLDEVARIADRILMLNAGHLVGQLDPREPELEHAFFEAVRLDDERTSA